MRIAGVGCRSNVSAEAVIAAVDAALAALGLTRTALDGLATVPLKAGEPALHDAARTLGLPLLVSDQILLDSAAPRTLTRSSASLAATGTPSACESTALAAAGPDARLLGPRLVLGQVTCAIAVTAEPT